MKRIQFVIEMDDDAPEGSAILYALGRLVCDATTFVDKKTYVIDTGDDDYGMRVVSKWMPPKKRD